MPELEQFFITNNLDVSFSPRNYSAGDLEIMSDISRKMPHLYMMDDIRDSIAELKYT